MNIFEKIMEGMAFLNDVILGLAAYNATPVDGVATVSFGNNNHLLEVSEGGEHWVCVSAVFKRVK